METVNVDGFELPINYSQYPRKVYKNNVTYYAKFSCSNEIRVLRDLATSKMKNSVPHIILETDMKRGDDTLIIINYIDGCNLARYSWYPQPVQLEIANKLLKLVSDFHQLGFIHGDVHSDNVMVSDGKLYLIDFDYSSRNGEQESWQLLYPSPEMEEFPQLLSATPSKEHDLWCTGVALYHVFHKMIPNTPTYWTMSNSVAGTTKFGGIVISPTLPNCVQDLLRSLLNEDPQKRKITFLELPGKTEV